MEIEIPENWEALSSAGGEYARCNYSLRRLGSANAFTSHSPTDEVQLLSPIILDTLISSIDQIMASIGIMDPAYFVGRKELLAWINGFLALDYTKIEQMSSGAAYVQLMDAAFPGQIPLSKVNYNARFDYEFSSNFKLLQNHFVKIKCDKVVPTDRLIKAKYQDNLEFMQWMKRFFEMEYHGTDYDAKARRKECKCEYAGDKATTTKHTTKPSSFVSVASTSGTAVTNKPATNASDRRVSMMPGTGTTTKPVRQSLMPTRKPTGSANGANSKIAASDAKVEELTKRCAELTIEVAKSETTREFYYEKLREIESLLAALNPEEETVNSLKDKINAILFSDGSA